MGIFHHMTVWTRLFREILDYFFSIFGLNLNGTTSD